MSFLFPHPQDNQGQKIGDAVLGAGEYGKDIPFIFGCIRVPSFLLWQQISPNVRDVQQSGGGKGDLFGGSTQVTKVYSGSFYVGFGLGEIFGYRKVWIDNTLIYNIADDATADALTASGRIASQLTFYTGSMSQGIDPTMAAQLGTPNTPAYRGLATMSINNYTWNNGRVPGVLAEVCENGFLVNGGTQMKRATRSVAAVLTRLCESVGISSANIDVSQVVGEVRGMIVPGSGVKDAIDKLLKFFDLGVTQSGSNVTFYPLNRPFAMSIPASALGATMDRRGSGSVPDDITMIDKKETDLPARVIVRGKNIDKDYVDINDFATKPSGSAVQVVDFDMGDFAANTTDLRQAAQRQLFRAYTERFGHQFTLPINYLCLEPGDVLPLMTKEGIPYTTRLVKVEVDRIVKCEGVRHIAQGFSSNLTGSTISGGLSLADAGSTTWAFMNISPLHDAEADSPGVYIAATGASTGWQRANIYQSKDGGSSYSGVLSIQSPAVIGTANTVLADGSTFVWDTTNTVTVTVLKGQLVSVTDDQVYAGANTCLIGSELVQFATATLIATNQYQLSRLLRGRRATEPYTATHGASEQFVLLTDTAGNLATGIGFLTCGYGDIGRADLWKAVPNGHVLADETGVSHTITGQNMIPFDPVQILTDIDTGSGSPDVTFSWSRRDRKGGELMNGSEIPLSEVPENYHLQWVNVSSVVVRDTYSTTPSFLYTHAMRAADFGSGTAHLDGSTLKIAQVSPNMGDGRFALFPLTTANSG